MITAAQSMRDDLSVVLISHIENYGTDVDPMWRLWTSGRMLTNQINLDGLFSYNIYTERIVNTEDDSIDYVFRTRTNGNDTCRTVAGCFGSKYIEPNLKKVLDRINQFELTGEEEKEETDTENSSEN